MHPKRTKIKNIVFTILKVALCLTLLYGLTMETTSVNQADAAGIKTANFQTTPSESRDQTQTFNLPANVTAIQSVTVDSGQVVDWSMMNGKTQIMVSAKNGSRTSTENVYWGEHFSVTSTNTCTSCNGFLSFTDERGQTMTADRQDLKYITMRYKLYYGETNSYSDWSNWQGVDSRCFVTDGNNRCLGNQYINYGIKYDFNGQYVRAYYVEYKWYTEVTYVTKYYYNITVTYSTNALPSAPVIQNPIANEVVNESFLIKWVASSTPDTPQGNLRYEIGVSYDYGLNWQLIAPLTDPGATSYNYDFKSTPPTTLAKIRIRAFDGVGYGDYGTSSAFTVRHNSPPIITVSSTSNMSASEKPGYNVITLSGKVSDTDRDTLTITATIAGILKSVVIGNAPASLPVNDNWTLSWTMPADLIPEGTYSNIVISADDGKN